MVSRQHRGGLRSGYRAARRMRRRWRQRNKQFGSQLRRQCNRRRQRSRRPRRLCIARHGIYAVDRHRSKNRPGQFLEPGIFARSRERLFAVRNERIRDLRQGPDGWLYLLTDSANGKLLRIER